jgi:hypothetical protein
MQTFGSYLTEAQSVVGVKSGHMSHNEDLVFDLGVEGTRLAINFLRDVRDMLSQGSGDKKAVTTVKWDGAPALIMGVNPENGKFFVAKKGIFNKNPKLYYSHADIDADTSGDLSVKLKVAFTECAKLGLKSGVYQGDIMYTSDSLKHEKIDGTDYITFHPNTILYAVPSNSKLGKQIARTNIGIVWHTTFEGKTIAELTPTFGKNIVGKFRKTTTSWMEDATLEDVTGVATFTDAERKQFDVQLSAIGKWFRSMPAATLNAIHKDPDLLTLIHTYNNSKIRAGQRVTDPVEHANGLYQFIHDRYEKEIEKLKTVAAKDRKSDQRTKILSFFSVHPRSEIVKIFALAIQLADAKQVLIDKLNKASGIKTFLKTENGFKVTGAEGFVAISDRGATKLVDRMEFSLANFSSEFKKGFDKR